MTLKTDRAYGIRHKQTKEVWKTSKGKKVWQTIGNAKNAWIGSNDVYFFQRYGIPIEFYHHNAIKSGNRFDDQDIFEIFEYGTEYSEALQLLKDVIDSGALERDPQFIPLGQVIFEFLKSKKVV